MIKRLIFDVDGTLIRGMSFSNCIENTLRKMQIYSEVNVRKFENAICTYEKLYNNYNVSDYTNHIGNALNKELPNSFIDIFFEELKTCIPPKNYELIECIHNLSQNYELVLLTNFFEKSQYNRLNNMGIGQYFTECYGEKIIKPNSESYIYACGTNKPSECIMIGDNISLDIMGAKQAGLKTIFVNTKSIDVSEKIGISVKKVEDISNSIIKKFEI